MREIAQFSGESRAGTRYISCESWASRDASAAFGEARARLQARFAPAGKGVKPDSQAALRSSTIGRCRRPSRNETCILMVGRSQLAISGVRMFVVAGGTTGVPEPAEAARSTGRGAREFALCLRQAA